MSSSSMPRRRAGRSGRNGGQVIPGLRLRSRRARSDARRERGERLWRFAGGAADFVLDLVARHELDCERGAPRGSRGSIPRRPRCAHGSASTTGRSAGPGRIPEPRASRGRSPVPISTSADSPTTGQRHCSRCPTRASSARAALAAGARVHAGARVVKLDADGSAGARSRATGASGARRRRGQSRPMRTPTGSCRVSPNRSSR